MSTVRWNFIEALGKALFQAENRRINGLIVKLDEDNRRLNSSTIYGFRHKGSTYMPENAPTINRGISLPVLHWDLCPEMEDTLEDINDLRSDKKVIEQMIYKLLEPCHTTQEMRSALPESLVILLPELLVWPREYKEAFTIEHDERSLRQWELVKPKIEFYCATRLLY